MVFAIQKFCQYLLGSKVVVFNDHSTMKHLLEKGDAFLSRIYAQNLGEEG